METLNDINWELAGNQPQDYLMEAEDLAVASGLPDKVVCLTGDIESQTNFGALSARLDPAPFAGKRVRLSASVKADSVEGWAGIWMRVDTAETHGASFDNMGRNPIKGTCDWQTYEVILDVPDNPKVIRYGLLLNGKGKCWVKGFNIEAVTEDIPSTNLYPYRPGIDTW